MLTSSVTCAIFLLPLSVLALPTFRDTTIPKSRIDTNITLSYPEFSTPTAQAARVNTSNLPLLNTVSPALQDTWSGRLSIDATNQSQSQQIWYWYWPQRIQQDDPPAENLIIWMNGGPGCSSMTGLFEEIGAFRYTPGSSGPVYNNLSWNEVADVLYVDQPIGVGYDLGNATARDETDVANQFYGFLQNFFTAYPELRTRKLYLAGESYAGYYLPNMALRILNASPMEKSTIPTLQSILISDGTYSSWVLMQEIPAARFAKKNQALFNFSDEFVQTLVNASESCGYEGLYDSLVYPPKSDVIPLPNGDTTPDECQVWEQMDKEATTVNPAFWVYRVANFNQNLSDPISPYFSRPEVQDALHVSGFGEWGLCLSDIYSVFVNDTDKSPYTETILPSVLEQIPVTLWHGVDDAMLLSDADRFMIQNLTWNGQQGFQQEPTTTLNVNGNASGVWHSERQLTYIEVEKSGHFIPLDRPDVAFEVINYVLGNTKLE